MISRRKLLWSVGAGVAATAYPCLIEPRWLELTRTRVELRSLSRARIRILHLTDFHASWAVPMSIIDTAVTIGLAEKPDLVCLTGDYITFRDDFDSARYGSILRRLSSAAPTYGVLGNHDGGSWAADSGGHSDHSLVERILHSAGIQLLHNSSQVTVVREVKLTVVGVGDLWSDEIDARRAFTSVAPSSPVLLLSHNPDSKEVLAGSNWDLMLCGHTHGGQVIVPFDGPRFAPVEDKRFVAGLKVWGQRRIYVSRGVGSLLSVRFRCRPEVTVLDLQLG